MTNDKGNTKERIQEYKEELILIQQGIDIYERKLSQSKAARTSETSYEHGRTLFNLELEYKSKNAAMLQLSELMKNAETIMKNELDFMKKDWKKVLDTAVKRKGFMSTDNQRMVTSIKIKDSKKEWGSDQEKLLAHKKLISILNQKSNAKPV